jgi:hypothetical protein
VHSPTGCIAELPIGADDNRLEPGHQFEWFWLVKQAGALFEGSGLDESLTRAFSFAQQYGVDPQTGGVCASLDETGGIKDATQRIWAQTEYLRATATPPCSPRCRGKSNFSGNASCVRKAGSNAKRPPVKWHGPTCRRPRPITLRPLMARCRPKHRPSSACRRR